MECTKTIIDQHYKDNAKKIKGIASNILHNLAKINDNERGNLADTLVSESYIYVVERQDTLKNLIWKGKLGNVITNFMHKQIVWNGTKFKKTFIEEDYNQCEYNDEMDVDVYELDDEEIMEREFEHMSKIAHIEEKYQALDVPNRILYDLAIRGEYSTSGKLAKYLNLNRTTSYYLIKNLKEHLRDGYTN
jgi:hypothetical protein